MTQHADQPLLPPRQPQLRFTQEGPHLPRTVMVECQALLTRLLVEVGREEAAAATTTTTTTTTTTAAAEAETEEEVR